MTVSVRVYGIATMRNKNGDEKKEGIGYRETTSCMPEAIERAPKKMDEVGKIYESDFRRQHGKDWKLVDIVIGEIEKTGEMY